MIHQYSKKLWKQIAFVQLMSLIINSAKYEAFSLRQTNQWIIFIQQWAAKNKLTCNFVTNHWK